MSNTITAYFKGRTGVAESVYQYDYGKVLVIDGLDLPAVFEAHFANSGDDDAITVIGQNNRVAIPNACLAGVGIVTVYIYLHSGENDGEVEYIVRFAVTQRARPAYDSTAEERSEFESAVQAAIAMLQNPKKVNSPLDEYNQVTHGTSGQVLRTKGNGSTEWVSVGLPTDAQTAAAVSAWLDAHPEATTTVEDGSLTEAKLSDALKLKVLKDIVTPEMYGAKGNGTTDDTTAVQNAIDSGKPVLMLNTYLIKDQIVSSDDNLYLFGNGTIILNTINASQEFTIDISGDHIYIDGLTFKIPEYSTLFNNSSSNGVKIHDCSDVTVQNCKFIVDRTKCNGALDFYNDWKNVSVINCQFDVNTTYGGVKHAGGIWFRDFYNGESSNLIIEGCVFNATSLDEAIAVYDAQDGHITNVVFSNNILNGTGMPHLATFGGINTLNISGCIFTGSPSTSLLKLYFSAGGTNNTNETISGCTFVCNNTPYITRNTNNIFTTIKGCTIIGTSAQCERLCCIGCMIKLTANTGIFNTVKLISCNVEVTQTTNQLFAYGVWLMNCIMTTNGQMIQTLSDVFSNYVLNCHITHSGTANFFVSRRGIQYIVKNNVFEGEKMPTFAAFAATDVVMNNLFAASVTWPVDRPIGAASDSNTNIVES